MMAVGTAIIYAVGVPWLKVTVDLGGRSGRSDEKDQVPVPGDRHDQARRGRARLPGGLVDRRAATRGSLTGLATDLTIRACTDPDRGLAAQPRGDAPARGRAAGAAAADGPPAGGGRGGPAFRLPRRSVAPSRRHAPELPARSCTEPVGARDGDPSAQRAPSRDRGPRPRRRCPRDPWVPLPRARSRAGAVGPRHTRRLDACGSRRLGRAALAAASRRFYDETRPIARAFGIPDALLPADIDAFDAYVAAMLGPDGPIRVTATARDLARVILAPATGPGRAGVRAGPRWVRAPLRLDPVAGDWSAAAAHPRGLWHRVGRRASGWWPAGSRRGCAAGAPALPTRLRWMPQARRRGSADRRTRPSVTSRVPGNAAADRSASVERREPRPQGGTRFSEDAASMASSSALRATRSRSGGRRCRRSAPRRTPSSPTRLRTSSIRLPPWM